MQTYVLDVLTFLAYNDIINKRSINEGVFLW